MFISRQYFSTYSSIVGTPVPLKSKPANPKQKEITIDQIIHLPQEKGRGYYWLKLNRNWYYLRFAREFQIWIFIRPCSHWNWRTKNLEILRKKLAQLFHASSNLMVRHNLRSWINTTLKTRAPRWSPSCQSYFLFITESKSMPSPQHISETYLGSSQTYMMKHFSKNSKRLTSID